MVGAGPTGLVLALWLARLGVQVRIVDRTAGPVATTRALGVQARTLELYRQVGLADAVVERGLPMIAANVWARGRKVGRIPFGDLGEGVSPFPYVLIFPQDEHERLLVERLRDAGVEVERRTELVGFDDRRDRVLAWLRRPDGAEEVCDAAFLAGCDGARSTVREQLGVGFPGGTYSHLFYVADVRARGPAVDGELHVALDDADFVGVFPLKGAGRARLIGTVRPEAERSRSEPTWDDVSPRIFERMRIEIERVNWFSTYHVHHRVASRFRVGRTFLLGDAGHVHSPVGAQGMNTGIGDAVNLAWKLAAVLRWRADARLLDSYEAERIAFARDLVATTDRVFTLATSDGAIARLVRGDVAPRLVPWLLHLGVVRRFVFRTVSQTAIDYRGSALSEGVAGTVHGGDRLPWVRLEDGAGADNFAPLESLDWQVHVYGEPAAGVRELCARRGLALHAFPWRRAMARAGLAPGAVHFVRPDGYVALADRRADARRLAAYLDARGVRPRAPGAGA